MTDSNQSVVGSIDYTAFGQAAGSAGSSANPYMWNGDWGYRNDSDAGLVHVGARYYDSQVGRFVTRDTVLIEHPYVYCDGDPVNAVDPSGHIVWLIVAVIAVDLLVHSELPADPPPPHYRNESPPWISPWVVLPRVIPWRIRIGLHSPHHGLARHLQVILWQPGVKGSHRIWRWLF